jgi:hypothetical protein
LIIDARLVSLVEGRASASVPPTRSVIFASVVPVVLLLGLVAGLADGAA